MPCATGGVVQGAGTDAGGLNEMPRVHGAVGCRNISDHGQQGERVGGSQLNTDNARDGIPFGLVQPEKPNEPPLAVHVRGFAVPV